VHQNQYWLNPKVESSAELEEQTKKICEIYRATSEMADEGIRLYSTDECTGIQAKERINADKPLKKGRSGEWNLNICGMGQ
jgi:hypothetical protein